MNQDVNAVPNYNGLSNSIETKNIWELLLNVLGARITTAKVNGKECYKIDDFYGSDMLHLVEGRRNIYIEKDTGLLIRTFGGSVTNDKGTFTIVNDYLYEFGTVTDDNFIEPKVEG